MSTTEPALDPITLGVLGGALQAIGLEMGHALKRMAYSPAAQQVEDLGGGLFTADGREICESDTTPMHIGSIPAYIRGFLRRLEGKVDPGDIIIHNNPYHGASHSPDLCVAIPIFWEGELLAWSASTIHLSDTGGVFPGIAIDVHDVWAESKIYDSLKLYERGVRNEQLWQFFIDNTRTPSYVIGDTEAMIAAGDTVAVRYVERGRSAAPFRGGPVTGQSYEIVAMEWFVLRDGKIHRRWGARDSAAQNRQMGLPLA